MGFGFWRPRLRSRLNAYRRLGETGRNRERAPLPREEGSFLGSWSTNGSGCACKASFNLNCGKRSGRRVKDRIGARGRWEFRVVVRRAKPLHIVNSAQPPGSSPWSPRFLTAGHRGRASGSASPPRRSRAGWTSRNRGAPRRGPGSPDSSWRGGGGGPGSTSTATTTKPSPPYATKKRWSAPRSGGHRGQDGAGPTYLGLLGRSSRPDVA